MFNSFFNRNKEQRPYTRDEALYAAAAQDEIGHAIKALLAVAERLCCNKKLPKQISALAEMLQAEAEINHSVITTFLTQQEQL